MKFLELFAGISGIGHGLTQAGMECVGYVEWDKYAHQAYEVLHDPERRLWSAYDIRDVSDGSIRELGERIDGGVRLIAAGFPCQTFSIAGKREGFADQTRGTLFFEVVRFASVLRPEFLLLENVDGLRNHDGGRTLGIILGTLDELGYVGEWQVLNSAAYVPQNRERIFIVASLRGCSAGKIFPFGRENSKTIDVIGRLALPGKDQWNRVYGTGGVAPALSTMQGGRQEPKILDDQGRNKSNKLSEIAPTLRAQSKGNEPKIVIAGQLDCDSGGTGKIYAPDGIAPTQLAQHGNAVTKIIDHKPTQYSINGEGIAYCLDAGYQKGINDNPNIKARRTMVVEEPRAVLTPDRMEKRQNGRRMKEPGEPMFTLTAQDLHGVVIVDVESGLIHSRGFETRDDGLSHCLKGGGGGSSGNFIYQRPRGYNKGGTHDIAPTLTSNSYQDNNHAVVGHRIRKLTPLECFRLQSYPDWWYVKLKLFRHPELIEQIDMTRNDITEQVLSLIQRTGIKEGISDSQLYKMAGNGVTSILAFEIGCRILDVINQ